MCAKASFDTLPTEILKQIIQLLEDDQPALLQAQLTYQKWSQIAQKIFYKKVDINDAWQGAPLLRTLQSNKSIAHLVKELYFYDTSFADNMSLSTIIRLCPHLKIVDHGYESTENYYPELLRLFQDGHLQEVEQIGDPVQSLYGRSTFSTDYNNLMIAMKKSITRLYISESTSYFLASILKDFTRLRDIEFESETGVSIIQLGAFLTDECPTLKTIVVLYAASTPDQHQVSLNHPYTSIVTMPQIEFLSIDFRSFSMLDLQLIMHMFPKLKKIHLNMETAYAMNFNTLIADKEHSKAVICKFLIYLSHMESFYACRFQLPTDVLFATISNVAKIFSACTDVSINLNQSYRGMGHHKVTIESNKHMSVSIEISLSEHQLAEKDHDRLFSMLAKELNITTVSMPCSLDSDRYQRIFGGYVDFCLSHFQRLGSLELFSIQIPMFPLGVSAKIMHFNHLWMDDCQVYPDVLLQMSQRMAFIDKLEINSIKERNSATGSTDPLTQLNMPFTTFKTLDICNHGHGRTNYIVKICRASGIVLFYVDMLGSYSKLTSSDYLSIKATFPELVINCADVSFLKINGKPFEL